MTPLFIATEPFGQADGERWVKYIEWSGLRQLDEVVTLDPMLCPTVLPDIKDSYWPHIVNEDFLLNFFTDLHFLKNEIKGISDYRLLCVVREPGSMPSLPPSLVNFDFVGFDLIEFETQTSALTNCGGFEGAFTSDELSSKGLISDYGRAIQVQQALRKLHPEEHHANCEVWAIFISTGR